MKYLATTLLASILPSCIAGGIGQFHDPAKNHFSNGDYHISMELTAPGGNAKRGFKSAQLVVGGMLPIEMSKTIETKERVVFEGVVPRSKVPDRPFDYYFTYSTSSPRGDYVFRPHQMNPVTPPGNN